MLVIELDRLPQYLGRRVRIGKTCPNWEDGSGLESRIEIEKARRNWEEASELEEVSELEIP